MKRILSPLFFFFFTSTNIREQSLLKLSVYLSVQISKKEGEENNFKNPLNNPQLFSTSRHSYNLNHRNSHNLVPTSLSSLSLSFPYVSFNFQEKKASSSFSIREIHRDNEDKRGHLKGRVGSKLRPKEPIATLYAIHPANISPVIVTHTPYTPQFPASFILDELVCTRVSLSFIFYPLLLLFFPPFDSTRMEDATASINCRTSAG